MHSVTGSSSFRPKTVGCRNRTSDHHGIGCKACQQIMRVAGDLFCAALSGKVGSGLLQGKPLCHVSPSLTPPADLLSSAVHGGDQLSAFIKHSHTNQLESAATKIH